MNFLKNHPFAVEAHFEHSLVLTFAVPKKELQSLIPECLELDTFADQWAFLAVAMVQTKHLRPKGFPTFLGNNFFLVGYRVFVRYTDKRGKRLRGLYILKSETDKKMMRLLGNLFTHYNYTTTDIKQTSSSDSTTIRSIHADFEVVIDKTADNISIPEGSPFTDWKEARRFAGPLPHTFTYEPSSGKVLIIEGVRQNWHPQPVQVTKYHFKFLDSLGLSAAVLANSFEIRDIPYYWKKGRVEKWK